MFTWINKQGVQSDTAFVVQFTGRFTLEYRKGNFQMECDVEHLGGKQISVCVPKLPFGNLTEQGRSEIVQAIRDAVEFQGLEVDID